jgi:hypothetical protein
MPNEDLRFPDWQALLHEVILEYDREKLAEKVQMLETLIFERLQKPMPLNDDPAEREALDHALSTLRDIKRDRLGFPDWEIGSDPG